MSRRDSILIVVGITIAIAVAGWFLLVSPQRKDLTAVQDEVATAQSALDAANAQVAGLQAAKQGYEANYVAVTRLGKAVPADDDVRSLMLQVDSAAEKAGVEFNTINASGNGTSAGGAPPAGATTTVASQTASATLPPGTSVGTAGFPTMPFSFDFAGSFFELSDFFARLDDFVRVSNQSVDVTGRLLHVDSFSLKPATNGFPSIDASVSATAYVIPPDQGLLNGATPVGPALGQSVPATDRTKSPPLPGTASAAATGATNGAVPANGAAPAQTPAGGSAVSPVTTPGGSK